MLEDLTFKRKATDVLKYAGKLHSNIWRTTARDFRASRWREYHGTKRPRRDEEIMVAWLARKIRRNGHFPVNIDEAQWHYDAGTRGPRATQTVAIDVLVPENDQQREIFSKITRVRSPFCFLEVS